MSVKHSDPGSAPDHEANPVTRIKNVPGGEEAERAKEEAFYETQEHGLAALRTRNQARARRKL